MDALKRIAMTPVYWAIGWVTAAWGEWMYNSFQLDIDFDEEDRA